MYFKFCPQIFCMHALISSSSEAKRVDTIIPTLQLRQRGLGFQAMFAISLSWVRPLRFQSPWPWPSPLYRLKGVYHRCDTTAVSPPERLAQDPPSKGHLGQLWQVIPMWGGGGCPVMRTCDSKWRGGFCDVRNHFSPQHPNPAPSSRKLSLAAWGCPAAGLPSS